MTKHGGISISEERPLTAAERELTLWMLRRGGPEAQAFVGQVDDATVFSRCPCGCASIDFAIRGQRPPATGLRVLGDYVFGGEHDLAGAFVFECGGVLAGIEVYGLARENPRELPRPSGLRPLPVG